MSDVFDEISDDLRREKLNQFWRENGSWIIGGAIAAVLLTGMLSFWRKWEYRHNAAATSELVQLERAADPGKLESFAASTGRKHATAARFAAAGTHLARGEKDKAVAIYNDIGGTFGLDKTYRELAKILSISNRLESDDPERLKKELSRLDGEKSPWRYTAHELTALLEAKQGHIAQAVDALAAITSDPDAPAEARARALTLRELYTAGNGE